MSFQFYHDAKLQLFPELTNEKDAKNERKAKNHISIKTM